MTDPRPLTEPELLAIHAQLTTHGTRPRPRRTLPPAASTTSTPCPH